MDAASRLVAGLDQLVESAGVVWQEYQARGPGQVEASTYNPVQSAVADLERAITSNEVVDRLEQHTSPSRDQLARRIKQLDKLARACACEPQGLCFITGEAGLIPRRDQHEAFEACLVELRQIARQLATPC